MTLSRVIVNVLFMIFPLFFQFTDKIVLNATGSLLFFLDPNISELNSFKSVWVHLRFFRQNENIPIIFTTKDVIFTNLFNSHYLLKPTGFLIA